MRRFIPYRPNLGDKRIRRCFAWLPIWVPAYPGDYNKNICPRGENVIWLEWVTVEEQWCWRGLTLPRIGWKIIREVAA